jgi:hypothetical protein
MERSIEPKRKGKERREKPPTPGTQDWYKELREEEGYEPPREDD